MTATSRPEDFKTIDANDGITIEKAAILYVIRLDGLYRGSTETLLDAMRLVEEIRKSL